MCNSILRPYFTLVDFLADYMGSCTEVVLHDLTDLEHSIVKIRHGYISGRKEGDPATNFVMRTLNRPGEEPYLCNYKSSSKFNTTLKSASYYIRDDSGKIVGMLCLNTNIDNYIATQALLDSFLDGLSPAPGKAESENVNEHFGLSISEVIDVTIEKIMHKYRGRERSLSVEDKEAIVSQLIDEGVFMLKGSIPRVASALDMSESTLYRYIQKAKSS